MFPWTLVQLVLSIREETIWTCATTPCLESTVKQKNETEPERRRVHTKVRDELHTVGQGVRIKSLVIASNLERKKSGKARQLDRQVFFGMWISTVEMMKERASCVQRLISTVHEACKKSKGRWTNIDPLQRRPVFSGDLAKNRRIGQLVPYLESSLDRYVVKLEVDKFDPEEHLKNGAEFGDFPDNACNSRLVQ